MEETKDMRMAEWREALRKAKTAKERTSTPRVKMPELAADYRVTCNEEVNQGLTIEMAMAEASRCLDCANPQCVTGCPVGIDIPGFIKNVERGEFAEAARVIKKTSALPAVCGRVCPQEKQCESRCIHTKMKHEAVAIGYLERFVADWAQPRFGRRGKTRRKRHQGGSCGQRTRRTRLCRRHGEARLQRHGLRGAA